MTDRNAPLAVAREAADPAQHPAETAVSTSVWDGLGVELRAPLLPPSDARQKELVELIERAFERLSSEMPDHVAAELSRRVGIEISGADLDGWYGSMDADDVSALLVRPPQHVLRRLGATDEELVELARRFMGRAGDEHLRDADWYMAVFDANVPHPEGSDLAFYPPGDEDDPTPEMVVKWATSYRPIQL